MVTRFGVNLFAVSVVFDVNLFGGAGLFGVNLGASVIVKDESRNKKIHIN